MTSYRIPPKLTLPQVDMLVEEMRNHPCLYNIIHSRGNLSEIWDEITANVFKTEWEGLSISKKAKRVRQLQRAFNNEKEYFVKRLRGKPYLRLNTKTQNPSTTPNIVKKEVKSGKAGRIKNRRERCGSLLLLNLLSPFEQLSDNDQYKALVECHSIIEKLYLKRFENKILQGNL